MRFILGTSSSAFCIAMTAREISYTLNISILEEDLPAAVSI